MLKNSGVPDMKQNDHYDTCLTRIRGCQLKKITLTQITKVMKLVKCLPLHISEEDSVPKGVEH